MVAPGDPSLATIDPELEQVTHPKLHHHQTDPHLAHRCGKSTSNLG